MTRLTQFVEILAPVYVISYMSVDYSWMQTKRQQVALRAKFLSQRYCHEHVGRLGLAISLPFIIRLPILDRPGVSQRLSPFRSTVDSPESCSHGSGWGKACDHHC